MHHHNIQSLAIEIFKCCNGYASVLTDILQFNANAGQHNLRVCTDIFRPSVKSVTFGENSLRHFSSIIWKLVPSNIKQAGSLNEFKYHIQKWKPDGCPCRLCRDFISGIGFVNLFE